MLNPMESVSHILIKKSQRKPVLRLSQICAAIDDLSKGKFKAKSLNRGVLIIEVGSSAAANNLSLQIPELIKTINTTLSYKAVKRIRVNIQSGDDQRR